MPKHPRRNQSTRGRRRRRSGQPPVPVSVLTYAVLWSATTDSGGTHDLHPKAITTNDNIFRPSSTTVWIAAHTSATYAMVQLYAHGVLQLQTPTFLVGPVPRKVVVRSPKSLDYGTITNTFWRYYLGGPGIISGTATFTLKASIDTLQPAQHPNLLMPSTSTTLMPSTSAGPITIPMPTPEECVRGMRQEIDDIDSSMEVVSIQDIYPPGTNPA